MQEQHHLGLAILLRPLPLGPLVQVTGQAAGVPLQGHLCSLPFAHRMVEQLPGDVAHLAALITGAIQVVVEETGQRVERLPVYRCRAVVLHGDGLAG